MGKKKPTIKEIAEVIGQIINQVETTKKRVLNLEHVVGEFITFSKKDEKFKKHMDKKMEEYEKQRAKEDAKDGIKGGVRDDKQQVVSSSKGCY